MLDEEWWRKRIYAIYRILQEYEVEATLTGAHGTAWTFRLRWRG